MRPLPHRAAERRPRGTQAGATLIEIMVASMLLTLVALAGGAYLYHARSTLLSQRSRRVALELANARMEALRAASYDSIKPPLPASFAVSFLAGGPAGWSHSAGDPAEGVTISGRSVPIATTVQYADADGPPDSYDFLRLAVTIDYRPGSGDRVSLETARSP